MPLRFLVLLATCSALLLAPAAAPARGLTLGFYDSVFASSDGRHLARPRPRVRRRAGARRDQAGRAWRRNAPARPPIQPTRRTGWTGSAGRRSLRARARDGGDAGVRWRADWAEGRDRRQGRRPGTWKPSAKATGQFATALARRFATQAQYVQVFNEPNLPIYLAPQWERKKGKLRAFAPSRYRAMLNASYPGVHEAGLKLVTAGTAPFGDPARGGSRLMPVAFWKHVLSRGTRFDVFAHHPYSVRGPNAPALNRNDVAVPDVHKLVSLVRAARRAHRVSAAAARHFWVTEISWDSSPPDPHGIPEARHARWLADSFANLWRQGVEAIIWFQIRDQAPDPELRGHQPVGSLSEVGGGEARPARVRVPVLVSAPRRQDADLAEGARARSGRDPPRDGRGGQADGAVVAGGDGLGLSTRQPARGERRRYVTCLPRLTRVRKCVDPA